MDGAELFTEMQDRHVRHLVYDGPYRLLRRRPLPPELADLQEFFRDWRQRIYRFDNRLGASVVLYLPMGGARMRWDLVPARFSTDDPFAFNYQGGVEANLSWREVQRLLDRIRANQLPT